MFIFGMVEEGPRGLEVLAMREPVDEQVAEADLADYGIDWEVHEDVAAMERILDNNPEDWEDDNPFANTTRPVQMNEVVCEQPNCPFSDEELNEFKSRVVDSGLNFTSRSMQTRRLIWQTSLDICFSIAARRQADDFEGDLE